MNLMGYPADMTVAQLIQAQQMAGTSFASASGAPVLYLMPPPPALPTPNKPGGGTNATNLAIAQLSATANERPPRAPPDTDVEMDGGGIIFDYGTPSPSPAAASPSTQGRRAVHPPPPPTPAPPPARVPHVSPTPGGEPIIASGVGALLGSMEKCFDGLVTEPARLFHEQYQQSQETKRIIAATTPVALEHSAEDIAAEVSEERAVTPKNLRGIVRLEANKITKDLERKVASLQAKLDKQEGCTSGTKKNSKNKKDFRRSGKAAATDSATKTRKGVGGPGNATSSNVKGSAKSRSKNKSSGSKQASSTKKRS
jgi:hypothetical protein